MVNSKKRLVAGLIAITCCCSLVGSLGVENFSISQRVVAAEPESGDEETPVAAYEFADTTIYQHEFTEVTAPTTEVSIGWSDSSGYKYKIMQITVSHESTSWGSKGEPVVDSAKYAVAVDGYSGSSRTVVFGNKIVIPTNVWDKLGEVGVAEEDFISTDCAIVITPNAVAETDVASLDLKNVEYIMDGAFADCADLTVVDLPETIKYIGSGVFKNSGVTAVTLDYEVTAIPDATFQNATNLYKVDFKKPSFLKVVGDNAFDSTAFTAFPLEGVGSDVVVGDKAFQNCKGFKELVISDSVKSLGDNAFTGCSNVTSISMGASCTSVGEECFSLCNSLNKIDFSGCLESLGDKAFRGCTALETVSNIPETLKDRMGYSQEGFGDAVFKECIRLKEIEFPNSITIIPVSTCEGCTGLTNVTLGDKVVSIGETAFKGCQKLAEVEFNGAVDTIGKQAFYGCVALKDVVSNTCNVLGDEAYAYCDSLKNIVLAAKTYGQGAFKNCTELQTVSLGSSIDTNFPAEMFYGCKKLTAVVDTNLSNVLSIGEGAFYNCLALTSVSFPKATSVGKSAFENCGVLEKISEGSLLMARYEDKCFKNCAAFGQALDSRLAVYIGAEAFYNTAVKEVLISRDGITGTGNTFEIGDNAFAECKQLEKADVQITDAVDFTLGKGMFAGDTALVDVVFSPKTIPDQTFMGCSALPTAKIKYAETVGDSAFEGCSSLETLDMEHTTGMFAEVSFNVVGEKAFKDCVKLTKTYTSGFSNLHKYSYENCKSITTAKAVNFLSEGIFKGCEKLETVQRTFVAFGANSIGAYCFEGCKSLKDFTQFTDGNKLFDNANKLSLVSDEMSIDEVGAYAFANSGITGEVAVYRNSRFVRIGEGAFENCRGISSVSTHGEIGDYAFRNCTGIKSAELLDVCYKIGEEAFYNCVNLVDLNITSGSGVYNHLSTIGDRAFANCRLLREFIFEETEENGYAGDRVLELGEKCIGYVDDEVVPSFLIVAPKTASYTDSVYSSCYTYANENGIGFQELSEFNPELRALLKSNRGDVDLNGVVNVADVVALQQFLLGKKDVGIYFDNADLYSDEKLNVFDMVVLRRIILGIDGVTTPSDPTVTPVTTVSTVATTASTDAETSTTIKADVTTASGSETTAPSTTTAVEVTSK